MDQIDVAVIEGAAADKPSGGGSGPEFDTFDLVRLHASFEIPAGLPAPIPGVLLLHGFGEDRLVWEAFRKQLLTRGWAVMALKSAATSDIATGSALIPRPPRKYSGAEARLR